MGVRIGQKPTLIRYLEVLSIRSDDNVEEVESVIGTCKAANMSLSTHSLCPSFSDQDPRSRVVHKDILTRTYFGDQNSPS